MSNHAEKPDLVNRIPEPQPGYWDRLVLTLGQLNKLRIFNNGNFITAPLLSEGLPDTQKQVIVFDEGNNVFGVVHLQNESHSDSTEIWRVVGFKDPTSMQAALFYLDLRINTPKDHLASLEAAIRHLQSENTERSNAQSNEDAAAVGFFENLLNQDPHITS